MALLWVILKMLLKLVKISHWNDVQVCPLAHWYEYFLILHFCYSQQSTQNINNGRRSFFAFLSFTTHYLKVMLKHIPGGSYFWRLFLFSFSNLSLLTDTIRCGITFNRRRGEVMLLLLHFLKILLMKNILSMSFPIEAGKLHSWFINYGLKNYVIKLT